MTINDEPWFVGKDVAQVLGYERTADAVRKHTDAEDRGIAKMETPSGEQEMTIINESGLYSLISLKFRGLKIERSDYVDLFEVKCLVCGKNFDLTEEKVITMTECRCPNCETQMSVWQFCKLKHEYYSLALRLHNVVSAQLTPLPDIRLFTWKLAEADLENTEGIEI